MIDGTTVETQIEERRHECLLMSSTKVQIPMRKTRRNRGRNAELYVIEVTPTTTQPSKFHTGEELTAEQCENFRSLLCDDFPELLPPVNSPHVSRLSDHPVETTGPMKSQRLIIISPGERAELNRHVRDAMEAGPIRPGHSEFGSPILVVEGGDKTF
jgi:hypothetical protein